MSRPSRMVICDCCNEPFVSGTEWDGLGMIACPDCVADTINDAQFPDMMGRTDGAASASAESEET